MIRARPYNRGPRSDEVRCRSRFSQQLQPVMQVKVTPKQIAANYILQMSSVELQEAIARSWTRTRRSR